MTKLKFLKFLFIVAVTIYAPIELSRFILHSGLIDKIWKEAPWNYILEIVFFVSFYVMGLVVIWNTVKKQVEDKFDLWW